MLFVALCEEGVDRNCYILRKVFSTCPSPSAKRAWIEILDITTSIQISMVALCEEGVDRNTLASSLSTPANPSPSAKRAWIEILQYRV